MKNAFLNILSFIVCSAIGQVSFADSAPNCVVPIEQGLWKNASGWSTQLAQFVDRQASWISTTAIMTTGQVLGCTMLSHQFKQVFTATLQVPSDDNYRIELLADDGGQLQIFQDSDSGGAIMSLESNTNYASAAVTLKQGRYVAILTNWDVYGYATAIVASIQAASGNTVLRTTEGGVWSEAMIPR